MKKIATLGLALGFAIAVAGLTAGTAVGPGQNRGRRSDHRPERRHRRANEERRRPGRRRHQQSGRHSRPEDRRGIRRRRLRSQAGRLGRQRFRRRRREIRDRQLQFRRHHPVLGSLSGERHPRDHAGFDQSDGHRARHVEHLPRLRPRRPAGPRRRRLHPQALQGQAHRLRQRQDHLRQGPRRRDVEDDQGRRHGLGALRRHQHRREGLLGAGLQDQTIRRRPRLFRRPLHRSRPDRAADARPGRHGAADGRRRHHVRRICVRRRSRRRRLADDLRARPAQPAGGQGRGGGIPRQEFRAGGLYALQLRRACRSSRRRRPRPIRSIRRRSPTRCTPA